MKWRTESISTARGTVQAAAPEIIAASRATDIPAFYAQWFANRLRAGYALWVNPFNQRPQYVSFANTRVVVLWSKNPAPLLPFLHELDARGLAYYLEFTLNDYEDEGWEPGLPPLARRVEIFRRYADLLGPERVVWRFDPLLLAGRLAADANACQMLLDRVAHVGKALEGCTRKLVFSFADVSEYRKVWGSLRRRGLAWRDFTPEETQAVAAGVADIAHGLGLVPCTCGEKADFSAQGVGRNRCIDPELILRLTNRHPDILRLFGLGAQRQAGLPLKLPDNASPEPDYPRDPGQRATCLCVPCKDVGQYDTCPHCCVYCYANTSPVAASRNWRRHDPEAESIVPLA